MTARRRLSGFCLSILCLATASPALGLANRVFVSARSGNDANTCDNVVAPCQSFAGAVTKLSPNGAVIVLDSGGYGAVTITQGVTIEAPAGVTAYVHFAAGDAIIVNAGADTVRLRGLVLNVGPGNGITVNSVGRLYVEDCLITGFANNGISMRTPGRLNVAETDIKGCGNGIEVVNTSGVAQISIDHCHLDGNSIGYNASTTSPGGSTAAASNTTANNNVQSGWICGAFTSTGNDTLSLEFCTGSENGFDGLTSNSANAASVARYSSCVFVNNAGFGVNHAGSDTVETRGNNTIRGNGSGPTSGTIATFSAL